MNSFISINKKNNCSLCGSKNLKNFFTIPSLPITTTNNFPTENNKKYLSSDFITKRCSYCKNIQLTNTIKFKYLYKNFRIDQKASPLLISSIKKKN